VRRAAANITLILLGLAAAAPAVHAQGLDLRVGAFLPRQRDCGVPSNVSAEYTLFQDVCDLYAVGTGAFDGVYGGIEYNHVIMNNVELAVHFDGHSKTVDTFYRDYERPGSGGDIFQTLRLQTAPLGVSLRFIPTAKRHKFAPFVGGGVDAVFYKYEEWGDFIDFFDPDLPIYNDAFVGEGTAFGVHALGGFRLYVNRDFAIVGEARYQWAKADMNDDFAPNAAGLVNTIDLSGWTFTGGVHLRF
jgi:outer membrane protein W